MAKVIQQTLRDAATGSPIALNYYGLPWVGLQVNVSAATITWTIEGAIAAPNSLPASGDWMASPDTNLVSQTVQRQGKYDYPITHIRLVTTGTGSATLRVLQAGLAEN